MPRIISCTLASLVGALALMIAPAPSFASGAGSSPTAPESFGFTDGWYAGERYSSCPPLAEPTGIKVPVYTPYYGTPAAYAGEEAFAEAEFEMTGERCLGSVWVTVRYKEANPKYNVVINTTRLYSSKAAETSIAQVADEPGPLVGEMLDGREGCIQASVYIDGVHFLGLASPAATMQWGECIPPWLRESTPESPELETPPVETKTPDAVAEQPKAKGEIGTAYHAGSYVVKARLPRKKRVCYKHHRKVACKRAKKTHRHQSGGIIIHHPEE